jgi:hypothetical protein
MIFTLTGAGQRPYILMILDGSEVMSLKSFQTCEPLAELIEFLRCLLCIILIGCGIEPYAR